MLCIWWIKQSSFKRAGVESDNVLKTPFKTWWPHFCYVKRLEGHWEPVCVNATHLSQLFLESVEFLHHCCLLSPQSVTFIRRVEHSPWKLLQFTWHRNREKLIIALIPSTHTPWHNGLVQPLISSLKYNLVKKNEIFKNIYINLLYTIVTNLIKH